jgi:hypothetical protein
MHPAVQGLLAGLALAVILLVFEYSAISREVAERSKKLAKKVEWDSNQKARVRGMWNFAFILPIAFAIGAWLIWG